MTPRLQNLRNQIECQQYQAVKEGCDALLEEAPSAEALILLALTQIHMGEREASLTSLQKAESVNNALSVDAMTDLAAVYIALGRTQEAVSILEQAIEKQPQHDLAMARLGWCYMNEKGFDNAIAYFSNALEINPSRFSVGVNLITVCLLKDKLEKAEKVLEQQRQTLASVKASSTDYPADFLQGVEDRLNLLRIQFWVKANRIAEAESWLDELKENGTEAQVAPMVSHYAITLSSADQHTQAEQVLGDAIKRYPDNQELVLQLSELAEIQGRRHQSVHLINRLLKDDPENPELHIRLANVSMQQNEQFALQVAEKAMALSNELTESEAYPQARIDNVRMRAKAALAAVKSQLQAFDEADALYQDVLAQNPHFMPALKSLGQQYMQQGKIDEAVEMFDRVKQIDPVVGYSALINARKFPEDVETLEKLDKAARTPSMEGSTRSGILFQLASAWEKRKEYDKAMAYADEANALSRRFLKYDAQQHRQECARVRYAFSKSFFEHRKACGVGSDLPVFVLGMPRSGTTLIEQILSGHSEIFGAGELGVIPSRIQGLNRWERHTGSGRVYPDCLDDVSVSVAHGIADGILEELQAYGPEAKHIVDKLPHNFENIGLIKFFFPNARIISVRRDPRDIALSNYFTDYQAKHGGMGFAYDMEWIGQQLADHNLMMHHWHEVFPNEILEINYEDVVDDLEGSARKMLAYIGVEWEPEVVDFNKVDRAVKTASVWQVRQPIYKSSKAKWKRYQNYMAPLIQGTKAKIEWQRIEDMISLPVPGYLTDGVDLFHEKKFDDAERLFKTMLHFNPEHAAANYMVGLVYFNKGHVEEGIPFVEKALDKCPWHKEWRESLLEAFRVTNQPDKIAEWEQKGQQIELEAGLDEEKLPEERVS